MSIIDLARRVTSDWDKYNENIKSYESYIYIKGEKDLIIQSNTSINITVGDTWYNSGNHSDVRMPDSGVKIKPQKYVVFSTEQYFGIPRNVVGMVVGKGVNIYNGGVISTGKIVPGYKGKLRIGYYNANNSTVVLHKGDLLGCCVFFNTELTVINEYIEDINESAPALEQISRKRKFFEFCGDNWYNIVSIVISVIAVVVALVK